MVCTHSFSGLWRCIVCSSSDVVILHLAFGGQHTPQHHLSNQPEGSLLRLLPFNLKLPISTERCGEIPEVSVGTNRSEICELSKLLYTQLPTSTTHVTAIQSSHGMEIFDAIYVLLFVCACNLGG